jgi:hypothetical protein
MDMGNGELAIRSRARRGWLCLAVVTCAGCGGSDPCYPPVGDFVSHGFQVESASVAWALDTVPLHSAAVVAEQPSVGDCQLHFGSGLLPAPSNSADCQRADGPTVYLDCVAKEEILTGQLTSDPYARWLINITGLGDPRSWSVGLLAEAVPYPTGQVTPYLGEQYPLYIRDSAGCRTSDMVPGGVAGLQLTAEEAVGGAADYPAMVTPDYRRVLRIDLDRSVTLQTDGGTTCGVTATMILSLRLVQTAADFTPTQRTCGRCV